MPSLQPGWVHSLFTWQGSSLYCSSQSNAACTVCGSLMGCPVGRWIVQYSPKGTDWRCKGILQKSLPCFVVFEVARHAGQSNCNLHSRVWPCLNHHPGSSLTVIDFFLWLIWQVYVADNGYLSKYQIDLSFTKTKLERYFIFIHVLFSWSYQTLSRE